MTMPWRLSWRADPAGAAVADRHYSRQKIGAAQFVPPGACLVLMADGPALWVTSWPRAEYVKHAWAGAWMCSIFRNEGPLLSSELIRPWPRPATSGPRSQSWAWSRSSTRRRSATSATPGGASCAPAFRRVGVTKEEAHVALQLLPAEMPEPAEYLGAQRSLLG